ncbi:hypothetical protein [Flavobacterium coralii]|uniref:hypothetical protein n=1 Tax=Flavobacterium coralii TaxID=2838017 RepID=UPI000C64809A|nr:hypothetical protein [Flavobacterium coralii]MBE98960.1 hypothetical protein [Flavobacterium sp.]MBY8961616.1 hypothetical protein [Flavobacterium coralii]|tara:strand:+ start:16538 stop:16855 length:318 start_codon:yes stop_codon:yes gene_type:complete
MNIQYHYATVLQAINELKEKGYTEDFNLEENCLACATGKFNHDEFEISDIYYYEGESNPDDEATVYGIVSHSGTKGILVTGDETFSDPASNKIIEKLLVNRSNRS